MPADKTLLACVTWASLLLTGPCWAQPTLGARADAALTYSAHHYLQAEQQLEEWLAKGLVLQVDQQLGEDFAVRGPTTPDFDKNRWLQAEAQRARQGWIVRNIDVQSQGDIRIVSFQRVNRQTWQQQFVVDVWSDSQNKLLSRYESMPWLPPKGQKSTPAPSPQGHIRPDGKG